VIGEKCPECGADATRNIFGPGWLCENRVAPHVTRGFDTGEGGETHGICAVCADLRNREMWEGAAFRAVEKIANTAEYFTADEVDLTQIARARDKRALGGVMLKARNLGLIEPTDTFRSTARVGSHASPRRVWKSNVVGERANVQPAV
jgi:hypothetical protein